MSQLRDLFMMCVLAISFKSFVLFDAKQINSFPNQIHAGLVYSVIVQKPTDFTI